MRVNALVAAMTGGLLTLPAASPPSRRPPLRATPRKPCISMGRLRPAAQPTSSHASLRRDSRGMGSLDDR